MITVSAPVASAPSSTASTAILSIVCTVTSSEAQLGHVTVVTVVCPLVTTGGSDSIEHCKVNMTGVTEPSQPPEMGRYGLKGTLSTKGVSVRPKGA